LTHGGITKLDFVYAVQYQGQAIVAIVIGLSVNLKAPMEGVKGKSQPTPWLQSYRTYRPVPHLHHFTVALFLSLEGLMPGTGIRQFCTCFFRASMLPHPATYLRFAPNLHLSLSVITFRHPTQPFLGENTCMCVHALFVSRQRQISHYPAHAQRPLTFWTRDVLC
jgi:hypothetical protein